MQDSGSLQIIPRMWNNHLIKQRSDGYVNATQMCQATKRLLGHYLANENTKEFLAALESDIGIPISSLVQIKKGGRAEEQGTWAHPQVAIHLGQWCSAQFSVQVTKWIMELLTKGSVHLEGFGPQQFAEMEARIIDRVSGTVLYQLVTNILPTFAQQMFERVQEFLRPSMELLHGIYRRREPSRKAKLRILAATRAGGCLCPLCRHPMEAVVTAQGKQVPGSKWLHWYSVERALVHEIILVCEVCASKFAINKMLKNEWQTTFDDFQRRRDAFERVENNPQYEFMFRFDEVDETNGKRDHKSA